MTKSNLKNELKIHYLQASIDKDLNLKELIINKWVHRFGYYSLNELEQFKKEEFCSLKKKKPEIDKNNSNIKDKSIKKLSRSANDFNTVKMNSADQKEVNYELKVVSEISEISEEKTNFEKPILEKRTNYKNDLPLPSINNLRKWISQDINQNRKAS